MANLAFVKSLEILLPPFAIQKTFIAEAEKEQEIINSNKQLIQICGAKNMNVLSDI